MASKIDDTEYLSPAKRLKLDNCAFLDNKNVSNSSSETPIQENNSTLSSEELPAINFEVHNELSDLHCSPLPSGDTLVEGLDLVEPLIPDNDLSDLANINNDLTSSDTLNDPSIDVDALNDPSNDTSRDDEDEVSSTVSNLSDISGFSDISGLDWKSGNISGTVHWIQKQMASGINPRDVLTHILGPDTRFPEQIDDQTLWRLVLNMVCEPKRRQRLRHITTFNDVIHLLKTCSKIIVLTGAGVSVSCGIPDFRSRDGIYSRLAVDFPNLPDPQAMFDITYFKQDPRPFFKFAREIYPGQFKPSPCHRFIKMLERHGKLLRNYSQNIDTLEQVAGIENVIECHGSFATASCTSCGYKVSCEAIKSDVFQQNIPLCPKCPEESRGVMKPDIVFFGEGLPDSFHNAMAIDKNHCDLLIVIGSSLKVRPVALIPNSLPPEVPQILINRERLSHLNFDVELLGDGDVIIDVICRALEGDWLSVCCRDKLLTETKTLNPPPTMSPVPLFRNVLNGDCSEGEMSIDSTRDSGVGSTSRSGRQASVDSRMDEDVEDDLSNTESVVVTTTQSSSSPITTTTTSSLSVNVSKTTNNSSKTSVYEERIADNVAECCSVLRSSSTSCTEMQRSVRSSPCSSNSHNLDSIQRINFDSGGETILASPSHETTRLDCENSVNNIVVEEGRCNRHMSIDSTRDSGIGEGSNSSNERHMSVDSNSPTVQRISLVTRLPENSYFMISKGCYIFPGAEVYSSREDVSSDSVDSDTDESDSNPPI